MDTDRLRRSREAIARHGAAVPRGQDVEAGPDPPQARFGRMFPSLQPCDASEDAIDELVACMKRAPPSRDNTCIPAGFTYLGQFIDHDITYDPTPKPKPRTDPHELVNFRTPRLDLDSVYGSGPVVHPFLYDWEDSEPPGARLLHWRGGIDDLPRNHHGRALIGDARNDENVIVAQLHLLFIRFHNAVVDHLARNGQKALFEHARQLVRWHYQWIVVHDFLPKVVGHKMAKAALTDRRHFRWRREPFIPVEFSGAAYRFGHSMVRDRYGLKRRPKGGPPQSGIPIFPELAGFTWLTKALVIDWERFFDLDTDREPQASFRIDTGIAKQLLELPEGDKELPRRNLLRGRALGLPSGQDVACVMHARRLTQAELLLDDGVSDCPRQELVRSTPLWYYILCEAASDRDGEGPDGKHLGPVGGRIVAEVLLGLLEGDPGSYLSVQPEWEPGQLGPPKGAFSMGDLVRFVDRAAT